MEQAFVRVVGRDATNGTTVRDNGVSTMEPGSSPRALVVDHGVDDNEHAPRRRDDNVPATVVSSGRGDDDGASSLGEYPADYFDEAERREEEEDGVRARPWCRSRLCAVALLIAHVVLVGAAASAVAGTVPVYAVAAGVRDFVVGVPDPPPPAPSTAPTVAPSASPSVSSSPSSSTTWWQTAPDVRGGPDDGLGRDVATDRRGRTMVVGGGFGSCRTYALSRRNNDDANAAEWVLAADLSDAVPEEGAVSVSMDREGTHLAVGGASSVVVLRRDDDGTESEWRRVGEPRTPGTVDGAGRALAVASSTASDGKRRRLVLVLGTEGDRVRTWRFADGDDDWSPDVSIEDPSGSRDSGFGRAVALDSAGETLVVGAPRANDGAGAVFFYALSDDGRTPPRLSATGRGDANANAALGGAVAVSGDGTIVAVGAKGDERTRLYAQTTTSTDEREYVRLAPDLRAPNRTLFGHALSVSEDGRRLAVGAPASGGVTSVYAIDPHRRTWRGPIVSWWDRGGGGNNDVSCFGWAVAMSGDGRRVATGDRCGGESNGGKVRVYASSE